ncbi:rhomboid family intramembrane serine protease [Qingshengfaniella alkalisoli]|uniref:Rhomboid family intramembrane serine protease n=1 Tax=Qingshengfaniella alkalisoli TaxID=2599296 RepID=A0A5B8IUY9_9RHOB|nr:rhomboid family intramembrane serine protease [Qingshengfaniella alkalisoli]QDY68681.1 rhomboid family intramembrane serine protease [Qingshengfaniella alkalisoli]
MFPIRDHNPSNSTPFVNYALIMINVVVFLGYQSIFQNPQLLGQFFWNYAIIPARITQGDGLTGMITSMFLHGGWMHLLGNMLFLFIFGDNLEDQLGHTLYLAFYMACGIAAGLAQVMTSPLSTVPLVGASGAIAGVMGGYLLMFPRARVDVTLIIIIFFKIFPMPAWVTLGIWFALQLFNGAGSMTGEGGVAYWAHIGGFVAGAVLILPLWLSKGGPAFWRRTHGHPEHPEARYRMSRTSIPTVRRKR